MSIELSYSSTFVQVGPASRSGRSSESSGAPRSRPRLLNVSRPQVSCVSDVLVRIASPPPPSKSRSPLDPSEMAATLRGHSEDSPGKHPFGGSPKGVSGRSRLYPHKSWLTPPTRRFIRMTKNPHAVRFALLAALAALVLAIAPTAL